MLRTKPGRIAEWGMSGCAHLLRIGGERASPAPAVELTAHLPLPTTLECGHATMDAKATRPWGYEGCRA